MRRLQEVDALRSFALFGIALSNFPILAKSPDAMMNMPETWIDTLTTVALEVFVSGKFFVLFSFLFGWGFAIQSAASARAGVSGAKRFTLRLLGLLLIGVAHATLVFFGDILGLYALLGLPLLALLFPARV